MVSDMTQENALTRLEPSGVKSLLQKSVGLKILMAISGVILVGYLLGHLAGNLLIFAGPEAINGYAAALHNNLPLIWGTRVVLLLSFATHIVSAVKLIARNAQARPISYRMKRDVATNYAARTMRWTGPIVLFFVLYHLAHLTLGASMGNYEHSFTDLYSNLVNGFRLPWVTFIYVVANLCVGFHLYHGVWSMTQSVGINSPRYQPMFRKISVGVAGLITAGNLSIPLSVLLGIVS